MKNELSGLSGYRRRFFCILLAMAMLLTMVPMASFAEEKGTVVYSASEHGRNTAANQVQVIVENNTFVTADAPWKGILLNEWVTIDANSTMMSCVTAALAAANFTQKGADGGYISEINGLAEMDGGTKAGWMMTLNDWFITDSATNLTVANGKISAGDVINVMYTTNGYGADIGGDWNSTDTSLKALTFSAGTLNTNFASNTLEYVLTIPKDISSVKVTPTATNKDFQVHTYVGTTEYKRTAEIPVENGTVITVKSGDPSWPSMASSTSATIYTITVQKSGGQQGEESDTVKATVRVVPSTCSVDFYTGSDLAQKLTVSDEGVEGSYHIYSLELAPGTYYYKGTEGETDLGGMAFKVKQNDQVITFLRANYYTTNGNVTSLGDYTMTVLSSYGDVTCGAQYIR